LLLHVGVRLADRLLELLSHGSLGRPSHWVLNRLLLLHSLLCLWSTEAILIWRLIETSGRLQSGLAELHLLLTLGRSLLELGWRSQPRGGVRHSRWLRLLVEVDVLLLLLNLLHQVVLSLTWQLCGGAPHHVLMVDHRLGERRLLLLNRVGGGLGLHASEAVLRLLGRLLHRL